MGSGCLSAEAEATWAPGDSDLSPAWPDKALASGTPPPKGPRSSAEPPPSTPTLGTAVGAQAKRSPGPDNPHCQCSSWALGCWCRWEREMQTRGFAITKEGKTVNNW